MRKLVVPCLLLLALAGCGGNNGNSPVFRPTPAPTSAPQPQHYQVGQTGHVGVWDVTLNSVKTSAGDANDTPANGQYLILDVTFKNLDSTDHTISSILQFTFKDATSGQKYNDVITELPNVTVPDGDVLGGDLVKGQITYDVPKTSKQFEWIFASVLTTATGTWDITVA